MCLPFIVRGFLWADTSVRPYGFVLLLLSFTPPPAAPPLRQGDNTKTAPLIYNQEELKRSGEEVYKTETARAGDISCTRCYKSEAIQLPHKLSKSDNPCFSFTTQSTHRCNKRCHQGNITCPKHYPTRRGYDQQPC